MRAILTCFCNARVCLQASALSRRCTLLNQWCSYGLNAPVLSGRLGANAARSSVWRDRSFDLATTSSTPPPLHTLSPVERVRSPQWCPAYCLVMPANIGKMTRPLQHSHSTRFDVNWRDKDRLLSIWLAYLCMLVYC